MIATCSNCGSALPDSAVACPTCGVPSPEPPNVRAVGSTEERDALNERYHAALADCESRGCLDIANQLLAALDVSCAVVATDLFVIRQLVTSDKALYNNYFALVNANFRKQASADDETRRRVAEAIVLNGYGQQIVYAALSLDGVGLQSYAPYSIKLRDIAVAKRATVLEENSFTFVKEKCTVSGLMPKGYRAVWSERGKVGIAKLAARLSAGMASSQFPGLVLEKGTKKDMDKFLEIHIYGPFDSQSIESVRGPGRPKKSDERATLRVVKEHLIRLGKSWVDA